MSFAATLDAPYFTGVSVNNIVPAQWPVSLAGRGFLVDLMSDQTGLRGQYFRRSSIALLRAQADQSNVPSESSVNPDDLWRRSQESWAHGAGQTHLDRKDSDPDRFHSSKGVDPWTRWQLTLQPDTHQSYPSMASPIQMVTASGTLYVLAGGIVYWTYVDPLILTPDQIFALEGQPYGSALAIASDGNTLYIASGSGVYSVPPFVHPRAALYNSTPCRNVAYVRNRLMTSSDGAGLVNILGPITQNTLTVLGPAGFKFVGFAEGPSLIYVAGYAGDQSLIYRIGITTDGAVLSAPIVAESLPLGEVVQTIYGYLGMLLIGSDLGVRVATIDATGNLTLGQLIPTPNPVYCFLAQDRFVWFGWSNYDSTSTGLGRLDLSTFTADLHPAYASDLMVTGQGTVRSIAFYSDRLLLSVDGLGVYCADVNLVPSGTLDTGAITYGLSDLKVAVFVDARTKPLVGSTSALLSTDSGPFAALGSNTVQGSTGPLKQYSANQVVGEAFELRQQLIRSSDHTQGPTLTRHTLRSYPVPARSYEWVVPLLLEEVMTPDGYNDIARDVGADLEFLYGLLESRQLVAWQVGDTAYQVFVEDVQHLPAKLTTDRKDYSNTAIVRLKQFSG